jgi:hypothetical protein
VRVPAAESNREEWKEERKVSVSFSAYDKVANFTFEAFLFDFGALLCGFAALSLALLEDLHRALKHLCFPVGDLGRMEAVFGGDFLHRFEALDGL